MKRKFKVHSALRRIPPKGIILDGSLTSLRIPEEWFVRVSSDTLQTEQLYEYTDSIGIDQREFIEQDENTIFIAGGDLGSGSLAKQLESYGNTLSYMSELMNKFSSSPIPPLIKVIFYMGDYEE